MAYDMMREAMKELLAGNTTPQEIQNNIESISHIFLEDGIVTGKQIGRAHV